MVDQMIKRSLILLLIIVHHSYSYCKSTVYKFLKIPSSFRSAVGMGSTWVLGYKFRPHGSPGLCMGMGIPMGMGLGIEIPSP